MYSEEEADVTIEILKVNIKMITCHKLEFVTQP